ncbi:MAG: dihydrodipicolinate synthase family protein [Spirochaetaceae bacterium]
MITNIQKILKKGIVIPAMPLALTKDLQFDEKRQRVLVRYYLDAGAGGIAAAVHTTQFEIRDYPEIFNLFLEVVMNEIQKFEYRHGVEIVKVAGLCGKTEQAKKEAQLIKSLGYDLGLVSPTSFTSANELAEHYYEIGEIIPIIGFYLQPAIGGPELSYNFWMDVLVDKNLIAIKVAPFNRYKTIDVLRAVNDSGRSQDLILYTGNDDSIVIDLITPYVLTTESGDVELNFSGGLLGHWCVWTKKAVELLDEIKKAKESRFIPRDLLIKAQQITDTNAAFFDAANGFKGCIAGLHEVLRRQGIFDEINCFNPNGELSGGQMEEIDRVYNTYPELNDDQFVRENIKVWFEVDD